MPAPAASAHATPVRSEPADGTTLADGPRSIRLWFDEEIVARFSGAEALDADGRIVSRSSRTGSDNRLVILTVPAALARGIYTVEWKVLSAKDGHFRRGFVTFGVGAEARPSGRAADGGELAPLDATLRWVNLGLLAAIAGAIAVAWFVLAPLSTRRHREGSATGAAQPGSDRLLRWALECASLSLVLGVALVLSQAATLATELPGRRSFVATAWSLVGETRLGALWLAREGLLIVLGATLLVLRRARRAGSTARRALPLAAFLVGALVFVQALGGHAAAISPRTSVAVAIAAVHLLAACLWVGGLVALIILLFPQVRRDGASSLAPVYWLRLGILAAASAAALVTTGLLYAARQVASLDALVTTPYGRVLMAKIALLLAAGAFGVLVSTLVHPPVASRLGRTLRRPARWTPVARGRLPALLLAETALALAVLAAAAGLTALVPARGPEFAPAPRGDSIASTLTSRVDDLIVTLTARPNRAGQNAFQVIAASTRRPAPAPISRLALRISGSDAGTIEVPMRRTEPHRYRAAGDYLNAAGRWSIEVVVARPGIANAVARFDWSVGPAGPGKKVLVSDRPLGMLLTAAAITALLAFVAAAGWAFARRPRPRPQAGRGVNPAERSLEPL